MAIAHFSEGMLLGTRDTAHWGHGVVDVTNQYILEGVRGGFVTLALFVALLVIGGRAFARLAVRSTDKNESYLAWSGFACLIGHCVSFLGTSYFGQIILVWYLPLAMAGFCYSKAYAKGEVPVRRVVVKAPVVHSC